MSRVDVILALLDNPTQASTEVGAFLQADPDECWRCGYTVDNDNRVGACDRCIADLRNETKEYLPGWQPESNVEAMRALAAAAERCFAVIAEAVHRSAVALGPVCLEINRQLGTVRAISESEWREARDRSDRP